MTYKTFVIPIADDGKSQAKLNTFLNSHIIMGVEKHWVDKSLQPYWAFCVEYIVDNVPTPEPANKFASRIDYKTFLSDVEFELFAKLRDIRKEISLTDSTPAYAVLNNEQLANLVTTKATSKAARNWREGEHPKGVTANDEAHRVEPVTMFGHVKGCHRHHEDHHHLADHERDKRGEHARPQ